MTEPGRRRINPRGRFSDNLEVVEQMTDLEIRDCLRALFDDVARIGLGGTAAVMFEASKRLRIIGSLVDDLG